MNALFVEQILILVRSATAGRRMNVGTIYKGIGPEAGTMIEEEEAFSYALERCLHGTLQEQQEFREMLVEWFYSGSWVKSNE